MLEDIKKKIKEDNPHLADYDIKDYQVWDFVRLNEELSNCRKCKGIDNCPNSKRGFSPILTNSGDISYVRCKYYLKEIDAKSKESKLGLMYMPKDVLDAKMDKFDLNTDDAENRKKCMAYLKNFIKKYEEGNFVKGAYIFGEVGSGKTFLLSAFANELIERGHQVIFVYLPDLINDLKDDFEKLNEKINELKEVEILILDDFGVGELTGWIRDSILAPILNYRMSAFKPLFMSSNIPYSSDLNKVYFLAKYLKTKDDNDPVQSKRIMRRIDALCTFLKLEKTYKK